MASSSIDGVTDLEAPCSVLSVQELSEVLTLFKGLARLTIGTLVVAGFQEDDPRPLLETLTISDLAEVKQLAQLGGRPSAESVVLSRGLVDHRRASPTECEALTTVPILVDASARAFVLDIRRVSEALRSYVVAKLLDAPAVEHLSVDEATFSTLKKTMAGRVLESSLKTVKLLPEADFFDERVFDGWASGAFDLDLGCWAEHPSDVPCDVQTVPDRPATYRRSEQ